MDAYCFLFKFWIFGEYIISQFTYFFNSKKKLFASSFLHLFITSINHFIAFSCHSDFGCIANPLSPSRNLILLCGASATAWCYALCSHSASHRGAICAHSLTSELDLQAQGVGIFVKDEYPSSKPFDKLEFVLLTFLHFCDIIKKNITATG